MIFSLAIILAAASGQSVQAEMRAKAVILANLSTGNILYSYNPDKPVAPASLTKIMTMFLTLDAIKARKLSLNQKITIPPIAANTGGSAMHINAGEAMPVVRLLAGMAVSSGNDAATALALHLGGTLAGFARQMNAKARNLGMKNTTFKNPTGLPAAGHKTTAQDLLILCKAYLKAHPQALRFHSMTYFMHKGQVARNTNPLLESVSGVDGIKTGWTVAAGYNLIVTAKRGKTRLLAIILGCTGRAARDSIALRLLDAGFSWPANPKKARAMIEAT